MTKTLKSTLLILLCLCSVLCFFACKDDLVTGVWDDAIYTEDTTVGKGTKEFMVEIVAEEISVTLTVKTEESTLGSALYKLGLINNNEGMFDTVNGMKADYSANNSYWAFYDSNDNYMNVGIFETNINGGELYKFVYTIYQGI